MSPLDTSRAGKRTDWIAAATLLVAFWAIFALSPVRQAGDPFYSILLGENLYRNGGFALDRFFQPPLNSARFPGLRDDGLPYHLERVGEHLYYRFPPGSSVLSVPLIAAVKDFSSAAGLGFLFMRRSYAASARDAQTFCPPVAAELWAALSQRRKRTS